MLSGSEILNYPVERSALGVDSHTPTHEALPLGWFEHYKSLNC
jgi:hypothetical protein